jgi:caffeoyl-CoA O-methyltransferase
MPVNFDKIHDYLLSVTPRRDATLSAMEAYARRHGFPIIGPLVGRLLFQLATAIDAKRVLELGSGYGYSAYWFSQALGRRGGSRQNSNIALATLWRSLAIMMGRLISY